MNEPLTPGTGVRLVVVSNRLPVVLDRAEDGTWRSSTGAGGLVTALRPALERRGGVWVGWPGIASDEAEDLETAKDVCRGGGFDMEFVPLRRQEVVDYYEGACNEVLWPLFHDQQREVYTEPAFWQSYRQVNARFGEVAARVAQPDDLVWIHDYHLGLAGASMRAAGVHSRLAFFLHIPFPPEDIFLKLPWRQEFLDGLLEYDLVGFQTLRDRRNFVQCVKALRKDAWITGKGHVVEARVGGRRVRLGAFPIGIDYWEFRDAARTPETAEAARLLREGLNAEFMILGLDRLDYTKGIPLRMRAFRVMLESHPEMLGRVALVQAVIPSRTDIRKYHDLHQDIERLVSAVNGRFSRAGWVPIHYYFRSFSREELLAHYRAADVALVTPLKDGMNLVCKEYLACQGRSDGVLVLSEFAGAAAQLDDGALLVNPFDTEGVAEAIHRALTLPPAERRRRMARMRRVLQERDVHWWLEDFVQAAMAK